MQRVLILAGIMAVISTSANCEALSWQGVAPVQLGMTVKAAEQALKAKLLPRGLPYNDPRCYETWRADKKEPGIGYVIVNGKITVIEVYVNDGKTPDVTDTHGLGIGASEDGIRRAFTELKKSPGFYDRGPPLRTTPHTCPRSCLKPIAPIINAPFSSSRRPTRSRQCPQASSPWCLNPSTASSACVVGWAKALLRRAHHLASVFAAEWWARFALPTLRTCARYPQASPRTAF
jgi:hypothetical protein